MVPLIVSRTSRQRTGFTFLNSSVNQRSMVPSASAARPLVRTVALRSSQVPAEPGGVDGWVSQSVRATQAARVRQREALADHAADADRPM